MKRLLICLVVCLVVGCGESAIDVYEREQATYDRIRAEVIRITDEASRENDGLNALITQTLLYKNDFLREPITEKDVERAGENLASLKERAKTIQASVDKKLKHIKTNLNPKLKQQAKKLEAARIAAGLE